MNRNCKMTVQKGVQLFICIAPMHKIWEFVLVLRLNKEQEETKIPCDDCVSETLSDFSIHYHFPINHFWNSKKMAAIEFSRKKSKVHKVK
jgi:hypothetical protein